MNLAKSISKLRNLIADAQLTEARNLCLDLVVAHPHNTEVWMLRMDVHHQRGEFADAIECCQKILVHDPGNVKAHIARATLRLLLGDFQAGWPEYEWRLRHPDMIVPPTGRPRWCGESLVGKTIMLLREQGIGDTIQFIRYIEKVRSMRAARIFLLCQPELRRLFENTIDADVFLSDGDYAPAYDYEIPLLSLPLIFDTTPTTIPATIPYLSVKHDMGIRAVPMIVRHVGKLRVGLVWAGGKINPTNRHRSLGFGQCLDLLENLDVNFFSLQKSETAPQGKIIDLGPMLGDFADTAAAIQELDLVISVDTAVAHLAGALGKSVWALIPYVPDWRWMLDREDSPWYPTMRLFRQPAPGDWESVIKRVAEELKFLVEAK